MRKLIALNHISMDGVVQAGGGPGEDTSGGFKYGGWAAPFMDESLGGTIKRMLDGPLELLLGRKTFEIWEPYWPEHGDFWPQVNTTTKYVASNTRTESEWQPTVFLSGDLVTQVSELKKQDGPDLHVWGSSNLMQTLMKHDLVDQFWLMIYPLTLGSGKRLFEDGTIPAAFKVTETNVGTNGVIQVTYERAGEVKTGEIQPE